MRAMSNRFFFFLNWSSGNHDETISFMFFRKIFDGEERFQSHSEFLTKSSSISFFSLLFTQHDCYIFFPQRDLSTKSVHSCYRLNINDEKMLDRRENQEWKTLRKDSQTRTCIIFLALVSFLDLPTHRPRESASSCTDINGATRCSNFPFVFLFFLFVSISSFIRAKEQKKTRVVILFSLLTYGNQSRKYCFSNVPKID